MPTPFEAGKNARELGIDTSRKFVIVSTDEGDRNRGLKVGDIVTLRGDDGSCAPFFLDKNGESRCLLWSQLAYADEPEAKEEYVPMVGDRISLEGVVATHNHPNGGAWVDFHKDVDNVFLIGSIMKNATLLSRPTPKREMTLKQIEEKLGFEIKIVE